MSLTINERLRLGFFALMCIGLALASGFLWFGKIDGGQWTTLCLALFGVDRLSNAVSEGVGAVKATPRGYAHDPE